MSIVKPKTSEGRIPADAFISFNGQLPGSIRLEIRNKEGKSDKHTPTDVKYIVIDEDFSEVGGIRMGATQDESVKSNVCYGWENRFFRVRLKNGTPVATGNWGVIKPKCELYKGRLENFSFVLLLKVRGTTDDKKINENLASSPIIAKVTYHGQTAYAISAKKKSEGINDLAGYVVQAGGPFLSVKSEKTSLTSAVPVFKFSKAEDDSREYTLSVAAFLDKIEPYIKYVKSGGSMEEVESQPVPEATAETFADDNWIPKGDEPVTQDQPEEDLLF